MGGIVALDTEMVRCQTSTGCVIFVAAQVSVIDMNGKVLLNTYAKPELTIIDYNTAHSGITAEKLANAPPLRHVRRHVLRMIRHKTLVGHAVYNDLQSLGIHHPLERIVDIQRIPAIQRLLCRSFPKLKHVSKVLLNRDIQNGSHCSLEDATATADIFAYALRLGWV